VGIGCVYKLRTGYVPRRVGKCSNYVTYVQSPISYPVVDLRMESTMPESVFTLHDGANLLGIHATKESAETWSREATPPYPDATVTEWCVEDFA